MARAPNPANLKKNIKKSLLMQLQQKGADVAHFENLIEDYMTFYDIKNSLQEDIKKRGVSFETHSASGHPITKQNQSVKDLVAVNKQMLMILDKMKLTTDTPVGGDDGDEDL